MDTIIEHDLRQDNSLSSALTAIAVLLVAALVIGIALFAFGMYPFAARDTAQNAVPSTMNINLNSSLPPMNPAGQ